MAAAIYAACREAGALRTLTDIAYARNVGRKDLAWSYRILLFELGFKVPNVDPTKCIAKVVNKTNLAENTKRKALSIMKNVLENQISVGKDPMGIAGSVIFIASMKTGEHINQTQIPNASGVTEGTIRNGYKELKNELS
jgi:transcription initiation factor TFIIB